ncbi:hypothetical protein DMA11_18400 [Marinilabiliaceae bacterium JC017]|nr:hypothetical protein DMA11_18400 [Marinilabiliaceae bacterium JC017]
MKKRIFRVVAGLTFAVAVLVSVQRSGSDSSGNVALEDIAVMAQAQFEGGGFCPNGCLVTSGRCYCRGWWNLEDAGRR